MPVDDLAVGTDETLFREYQSTQGRWVSPDPLGGDPTNPQSLNRYAYVLNNPTTLTDPLGLCSPAQPDCHQPCQIGSCREPGVWPPPVGGGGPWNVSQEMLAGLAQYLVNNNLCGPGGCGGTTYAQGGLT
jgi:RHS repeat-associated protein